MKGYLNNLQNGYISEEIYPTHFKNISNYARRNYKTNDFRQYNNTSIKPSDNHWYKNIIQIFS